MVLLLSRRPRAFPHEHGVVVEAVGGLYWRWERAYDCAGGASTAAEEADGLEGTAEY